MLGAIAALFLIAVVLFALRWCVRRRRSRIAEMRQRLSDTSIPPGATAAVAAAPGRNSPPGSAVSGLTGEGEVRIVIRPARSQRWPMPPGHGGQTYSFFVEETTTGETTPAADPTTWSNASESGSVRNHIPRKPILSASGPGTVGTRSGSSSAGARTASGGGRSVSGRPGVGAAGGARDIAGQSLVSVGWGTSVGGRSDFSNAGVNTNLSPPPPARWNSRNTRTGSSRRWEDPGSWEYPGSWGIGKAI